MYEQFKNFSWLDFFLKIAQDFVQITLDSLVTLPSRDPPLNGNIESRSLPPRETRFRHLQISSDLVTIPQDLVTIPPDLVTKPPGPVTKSLNLVTLPGVVEPERTDPHE